MTHDVRVAFRTGGGRRIGLGHVRRCLSLAQALRDLGAQCLFLLDGDPEVIELAAASRFEAAHIGSENDLEDTIRRCKDHRVDTIVADSYALSTSYFHELNKAARGVAVIDDLADRELPVNLVINGSAGAERLRYRGEPRTAYLLGPQYMLLRPEFVSAPVRTNADPVGRVLITVGGSDPNNLTMRLMRWTAHTLGSVRQDVVAGPLFENPEALKAEAGTLGGSIVLHENRQDMRSLMLASDLALCGGGQTTYELAATGTPAIAIRTAGNQTVNLEGLSAAGSLVWGGDVNDADLEAKITRELKALAGDTSRRAAMSRAGRVLVDGQGAARVARALLDLTETPAS